MENTVRLIKDTETAAILGCSRATVWALVKAGTIPAPLKIGGLTRWRASDIEAAIANAAAISAPGAKPAPRNRVRTAA